MAVVTVRYYSACLRRKQYLPHCTPGSGVGARRDKYLKIIYLGNINTSVFVRGQMDCAQSGR